jgi:hypothetical protein
VATQVTIVERRGEQNIPKRYLKTAEWYTADAPKAYQGAGYYISDPDEPNDLIAVDFHFESLQWGITQSIPDGGF